MGPVEEGTGLEKPLRGFGLRDWIHEVNSSQGCYTALFAHPLAQEGGDIVIIGIERRGLQLGFLHHLALLNGGVGFDVGARVGAQHAPRHAFAVEARGDHGEPDLVAHVGVDHGAEDQVHVGVRGFFDDGRSGIDLE